MTQMPEMLRGIGSKLQRIETATNGAYIGFIDDRPRYVIKPVLEERGLPGNPFGHPAIERGFVTGEAAGREVLAFIIDFAEGWQGRTPKTEFVEVESGLLCAVRDYIVEHDVEPCLIDLEYIASLDIDEGAADRREGSILIDEGGRLWRIDQGLTRGREPDETVFEWREMLRGPMSEEVRAHIAAQDLKQRESLLEELGLERRVIDLELARIHLKKCAAARNLSFFDITCLLKAYPVGYFDTYCAFAEVWEDFGEIERLCERALVGSGEPWALEMAAARSETLAK